MNQRTRDFSEKRDFIRMQVSTLANIEYKGNSFEATCIDLSSNGCSIECDQSIEVNSEIVVEIHSGGGVTPPLRAKGIIQRVIKQSSQCFRYGISIGEFL